MGRGEEGGLATLFSRTTLAHAVAGSAGSVLAMTLTYPLDRVRTMKQLASGKDGSVLEVLRWILEKEGWAGLYKGLQPMLVALGASNFVYFYWFTALKAIWQLVQRRVRGHSAASSGSSALSNLALASLAGTLNVLITTPLWVAYTRLAVQDLRLRQQQNLAKVPPPSGKTSELDGQDLDSLSEEEGEESEEEEEEKEEEEERMSGMLDALRKIARQDGLSTLWSGMGPSLILVSNPSVQFASYERLKRAVLTLRAPDEPAEQDLMHLSDVMDGQTKNVTSSAAMGPELTNIEALLLGLVSKFIATVVTYPLQVAQTRLRAEANRNAERAAEGATEKGRMDEANPQQPVKSPRGAPAGGSSQGPVHVPRSPTLDCLQRIYKADGVAGLYRGMGAKLLQTCLTSAFMFAFYERISAVILRFMLWRKIASASS